jgi:hypothetical protein
MQESVSTSYTFDSDTPHGIYDAARDIGAYSQIHTVQQATDEVIRLFEGQINTALTEAHGPNKPAPGDGRARSAFWTVLAPNEQRAVFVRFCQQRAFWPRIRTLVGPPPFSFLNPNDNELLNPSGIARGRTNMSHNRPNTILSSTEIGGGHLLDQYERVYKIVQTDNQQHTLDVIFRRVANTRKIALDCKLSRMSTTKRLEIYKRRNKDHRIHFPHTGDELHLRLASASLGNPSRVHTFRVDLVLPKGNGSPVCRVFARVVS